ncbi:MAG: lysine--tRNA ligase [Deltaproteobacteria bacterium]|nr:lysine--tRNA ligase [Deltaproteobacteria bacterium]
MENQNDQIKTRLEKLENLRQMGINPYPYRFAATHSAAGLNAAGDGLVESGGPVSVAGRLVAIRRQGKAAFCHIKDDHHRIQAYVRADEVGEAAFAMFDLTDLGDFVGFTGAMMRTKTGELTLRAKTVELLSKAIRPLPVIKVEEVDGHIVVHDEVTDVEFRYRQRHVDLATNDGVAEVFIRRAKIVQALRGYLVEQGFLEVETPVLQVLYGGAAATPFTSHHKALDMPLFLRISDELYLKRLVMGGFNRVFEIGKDFRNEGIDRNHNPEFTMVEFYQAYADYTDMMAHMEAVWQRCAQAVHGSNRFEYQGVMLDVSSPWKRMTMAQALDELAGVKVEGMKDAELTALAVQHGGDPDHIPSRGLAIAHLFETLCEAKLIQPTFIIDFPHETTPLCKSHRDNPALVERFEPYIFGWEIGNAYSELNDPQKQKTLFEEQAARRAHGDQEAHPFDTDFVKAMEYGMPPMGGAGIGVDRMIMLLTNAYSIRDVIFFPTMKPVKPA